MRKILKKLALPRFVRADEGLVTIEWVGIAAIASVAAIAVAGVVFANVGSKASTVPTNLCNNAVTEAGKVTTATGGGALAAPCQ